MTWGIPVILGVLTQMRIQLLWRETDGMVTSEAFNHMGRGAEGRGQASPSRTWADREMLRKTDEIISKVNIF